MKSRSITGPVVMVVIGCIFLINNIWRDIPLWSLIVDYWPLLLIGMGLLGLFEVLYHASQGAPIPARSPIGAGGILWMVMLLAFVSWASNHGHLQIGPFTNGFGILGNMYEYDVNVSGASQGVTRVVLDGLHGNLSLKGEDGGDVKVSGRKSVRAFSRTDADRANDQTPIQVERQGDLLIIREDTSKNLKMISVSADLDITIPRGMSVETRGRSGDLTVDDIAGEVSVGTGHGDIRLSNIGKDVKVESTRGNLIRVTDAKGKVDLEGPRGGDVQLENIAGEVTVKGEYSGTLEFKALTKSLHFQSEKSDFHVEGVPGTISLDLSELKMADVTGPVHFSTSTRDITATDVTNGLEIAVQHGDIQVTQTKAPLPKLDIHSHNGDVTLSIPEKSIFELDGRTGQGEVTNDFGDALKSEQNGRAATIKGKQGSGPEIRLDTDRGAVTVKKS